MLIPKYLQDTVIKRVYKFFLSKSFTLPAFTCSKSKEETTEQYVKAELTRKTPE